MEVDQDEEQLRSLAAGLPMDYAQWPSLLSGIIARLDKIARHDFPIPHLPPPPRPVDHPGTMAPPSSSVAAVDSQSSSQEADKENARPAPETDGRAQDQQPQATTPPASAPADDATRAPAPATPQQLAPGALPPQIQDMLTEITTVLRDSFPRHPPHTIQRLAELILAPRAHYRHLAPYLHAVDRIVHITSISSVYPLPPAIPDMSTMTLLSNGVSDHSRAHANANANAPEKDPAAAVAWSNPTSSVGSDEALGGALLTPIPWLTRRPSPHAGSASSSPGSKSPQQQQQQSGATSAAASAAAAAAQHEIRTESTETIDGPNGMGSIETVTVNLNGPSIMTAGSAAAIAAQQQAQREAQAAAAAAAAIAAGNTGSRPITQGELLRQEQQRGVVPISQLARHAEEVASLHTQNAAAQVAAAQAAAVAAAVGRSGPGAPRAAAAEAAAGDGDEDVADREAGSADDDTTKAASADDEDAAQADEDEVPHARGPEEIGVGDLGPQSKTIMNFIGGAHAEMQGIDVEAAVGRMSDRPEEEEGKEETKEEPVDTAAPDHETASDAGSETSTKREADTELAEGAPIKRPRASASPESQDAVMTE